MAGEPLGARIEPHGQPVAGDRDRVTQQLRLLDDAHREDDPGRARGKCQADLIGAFDATGKLEGRRNPRRDEADGVEVDRLAAAGSVEVDQMDQRRALLDEVGGDPLGPVGGCADAGRRSGPEDDA